MIEMFTINNIGMSHKKKKQYVELSESVITNTLSCENSLLLHLV